MKEGGTMKETIDNQKCEFTMSKLKEIIISIVSMQIGAFIGIATMCFFQVNKGNGSSDKQ